VTISIVRFDLWFVRATLGLAAMIAAARPANVALRVTSNEAGWWLNTKFQSARRCAR
jgi:hypothetical protein